MSETLHGYECTEIGSGAPMTFSAPTPEQLDASVQPAARREQAADALLDQIELHGHSDELAAFAERLCEIPSSAEVRLAEQEEQLATLGAAVKAAEVFAVEGDYGAAQAALAALDQPDTFANRRNQRKISEHVGDDESENLSRSIDDDRARARAEEQAAENARAAAAAPQREHLLDEYKRPSSGRSRYPFKP